MSEPVVIDVSKPLLRQLAALQSQCDGIEDPERLVLLAGFLQGWAKRVEAQLEAIAPDYSRLITYMAEEIRRFWNAPNQVDDADPS